MLSTQRFCDMQESAQVVKHALDNEEVIIHPSRFQKSLDQRLSDLKPWCISRQLRRGHRIPVWSDGTQQRCIDEDMIHSKEAHILVLIIFNLIADGRLPNPFGIEQLIDILLEPCVTPVNTLVVHNFLAMYRSKYSQDKHILAQCDAIAQIFASLDQDSKSISTSAEQLVDMIA